MAQPLTHDRWDHIPDCQKILYSKSSLVPGSQAGRDRMVNGGLSPETGLIEPGLSQVCLRSYGARDVGTQPTMLSTQLGESKEKGPAQEC